MAGVAQLDRRLVGDPAVAPLQQRLQHRQQALDPTRSPDGEDDPHLGAWVRVDQRTDWYDADTAVDRVELRSVDGAVVARGRQVRRLPRAS